MGGALSAADLIDYLKANEIDGEVLYLGVPTPTVEAAAAAVGAGVNQIAKTILFLIADEPLAAIACGVEPVERRAIARRFGAGRKQVSLASASQVLEITGYPAGAVPPFGHLRPIRTLVDPRILNQSIVYAGGGGENALLRISPQTILEQTRAEVLDLLARGEAD